MTISVRVSKSDETLIKRYAKLKNISISELVRSSVIARIEDEIDLESYNRAFEEYKKDSTTYSLDEVKKELGL